MKPGLLTLVLPPILPFMRRFMRPFMLRRMLFVLPPLVLACWCSLGGAAWGQTLPAEVSAALTRAKVPREAVSLLVVDAEGRQMPRLSHRVGAAMNPASVMKLVTTFAALDLLGPAYTWRTPVYVEGAVRDGTLYGNLHFKGQGDPKLVAERLWLLLRRVQGLGIHTIAGDIVLDRSAFELARSDAASFDGEPLRPYNTAADALLLNFKSVTMTFTPDVTAGLAQVQFEPHLAGVQLQTQVPLSKGDCSDYRATLQADFADANRLRFAGAYPASCGEKVWSVAYIDPDSFNVRAVQGLWQELGGRLGGRVREGTAPASAPVFEFASPPLAEVIREINKFSNNVMAQQLFLTLSLPPPPASLPRATVDASREVLRRWWSARISANDLPVFDNGSGLSRDGRISAQGLGQLLQTAYRSPLMPELMASLPITGVDGTQKRSQAIATGRAHLKTGSLKDVNALAGYVHGASGKRYVLVALVNHTNANAARPVLNALVDWAVNDN